jgi:NTP pyrophosphatase (non-canonical NTP hydrolase)
MQDELGDALWYAVVLHHTTEDDYVRTLCESRVGEIMHIARACGWTIEEVGERNLSKLADRKARGVISGIGNSR